MRDTIRRVDEPWPGIQPVGHMFQMPRVTVAIGTFANEAFLADIGPDALYVNPGDPLVVRFRYDVRWRPRPGSWHKITLYTTLAGRGEQPVHRVIDHATEAGTRDAVEAMMFAPQPGRYDLAYHVSVLSRLRAESGLYHRVRHHQVGALQLRVALPEQADLDG